MSAGLTIRTLHSRLLLQRHSAKKFESMRRLSSSAAGFEKSFSAGFETPLAAGFDTPLASESTSKFAN
jgi:hypothetical protein